MTFVFAFNAYWGEVRSFIISLICFFSFLVMLLLFCFTVQKKITKYFFDDCRSIYNKSSEHIFGELCFRPHNIRRETYNTKLYHLFKITFEKQTNKYLCWFIHFCSCSSFMDFTSDPHWNSIQILKPFTRRLLHFSRCNVFDSFQHFIFVSVCESPDKELYHSMFMLH